MKKGSELPVNFIIIVVIALATLAAIFLFVSSQTKVGSGGTSSLQATTFCSNLCLQDNQRLPSDIDWNKKEYNEDTDEDELVYNCSKVGSCYAGEFCNGKFYIGGEERSCVSLTTCTLVDTKGNKCFIKCDSCDQT